MPHRRACDVCYKRKIQCLIPTPGEPCDWCKSQDASCTFERVIQKDPNKRTTTDVVQELSRRVEELEGALQSARTPNSSGGAPSPWAETIFSPAASGSSLPVAQSPVSTGPQLPSILLANPANAESPQAHQDQHRSLRKLSRCQLGNNWYFKGVGILSLRGRQWIEYGSGKSAFLEGFDIFGNPFGGQSNPSAPSPMVHPRLPTRATCIRLADVFCKSKSSMVFPILDRGLLEETISRASATATGIDNRWQASASACIWAMFALFNRIDETRQSNEVPDAATCSSEAKRLLSAVYGFVDLDVLQTNLLLKMNGQCLEAFLSFTSACHAIYDLGGHFHFSRLSLLPQHVPTLDDASARHARHLFLLCYCFDKDFALRTDSPPLLTSDYCDVDSEDWHGPTCRLPLTRDVHLAKIKENASRLLCSPQAFRYSEVELISHVRQLDEDLEKWRVSIEPRFRPRLSIPPDSSLPVMLAANQEDRTRAINLQLDFLFTVINIHTMVRKCGDFERNLPDDLHSVVHSSADLSIEASRSIFRFLGTVVDFWREDSIWVVSHYAPMAAMPLFINILIHPNGSPADEDLLILASIGKIIRSLPTERLSKEEIGRIQEIGEFVMELVQLGYSAAWKVKKGERERDLDIIHET